MQPPHISQKVSLHLQFIFDICGVYFGGVKQHDKWRLGFLDTLLQLWSELLCLHWVIFSINVILQYWWWTPAVQGRNKQMPVSGWTSEQLLLETMPMQSNSFPDAMCQQAALISSGTSSLAVSYTHRISIANEPIHHDCLFPFTSHL